MAAGKPAAAEEPAAASTREPPPAHLLTPNPEAPLATLSSAPKHRQQSGHLHWLSESLLQGSPWAHAAFVATLQSAPETAAQLRDPRLGRDEHADLWKGGGSAPPQFLLRAMSHRSQETIGELVRLLDQISGVRAELHYHEEQHRASPQASPDLAAGVALRR